MTHTNNFPKLHNAAWPGVVGKGSPGAEPFIDLDTMLDLTTKAEMDGVKFDGVDVFLFAPHVDIDASDDDLRRLADKVRSRNLVIGSVVAPVWPPTGGGSAMGGPADRQQFLQQVRKGCRIAKRLGELGVRPYGVVRIDSACGAAGWSLDAAANQRKIASTFVEACRVVLHARQEQRPRVHQPAQAGVCGETPQKGLSGNQSLRGLLHHGRRFEQQAGLIEERSAVGSPHGAEEVGLRRQPHARGRIAVPGGK